MPNEEPTYTLAEARRVLAQRECAAHGHSWDVISTFAGVPVQLVCDRCGKTYAVTKEDGQ